MGRWKSRNVRQLDISDPVLEKQGIMADACYNFNIQLKLVCFSGWKYIW
jgi:hypothetical protein